MAKKCVHPIAALTQPSPFEPRLMCKLCKSAVELPVEVRARVPSKTLVHSVAAFLKYITDAGDSGAQLNPRTELALILAMSDALHALTDSREEG